MMTALDSDRGQAGRSNIFKLSLQLGARWLICRLLTGGLTLSAAKLRSWENISLPTLSPTLKRSFSCSGKRRLALFFFFFVRPTIVASPDGQQDVQCSKVHLLAERTWTDDMQGPWASPLNVRAVSDLDVPTTYHKCVSCVFKSLSRTVRMPQQSRCRQKRRHPFLELVPRSAHLPSQWHTSPKSLERELRPHCRFLLPVTHALGDEIAEASFGRRTEPNTRIKNRYRYSCRC